MLLVNTQMGLCWPDRSLFHALDPAGLCNLQTLSLASCEGITSEGLQQLCVLSSLQSLRLELCDVSQLDFLSGRPGVP